MQEGGRVGEVYELCGGLGPYSPGLCSGCPSHNIQNIEKLLPSWNVARPEYSLTSHIKVTPGGNDVYTG